MEEQINIKLRQLRGNKQSLQDNIKANQAEVRILDVQIEALEQLQTEESKQELATPNTQAS